MSLVVVTLAALATTCIAQGQQCLETPGKTVVGKVSKSECSMGLTSKDCCVRCLGDHTCFVADFVNSDDSEGCCTYYASATSFKANSTDGAMAVGLIPSSATCKQNSTSAVDAGICDNYFNDTTGIAFSMLSPSSWQTGPNKPDCTDGCADFFPQPPTKLDIDNFQAMTIMHFGKKIDPYGADSKYGIVFSVAGDEMFWKYFLMCEGDLAGVPIDGYRCNRHEMHSIGEGQTYDWFTTQKNNIVEKTKDLAHNTFLVSGLSTSALRGILDVRSGGASAQPAPDENDVCAFMGKASGKNQSWPVFAYSTRDGLVVNRYLHCSKDHAAEVMI